MRNSRTLEKQQAEIYAQVLLDASPENLKVSNNICMLQDVLKTIRASYQLKEFLTSAHVASQAKKEVIDELFANSISEEIRGVLHVVADENAFGLLGRIVTRFQELAEEQRGIVIATVTTAVELDERLRQTVTAKLAQQFNCDVFLQENIDPNILGGIVVSARGKRMDASVRRYLSNAKTVLSTVSNGGEN